MNFSEYINPELLILVPVLYAMGYAVKKTSIKDKHIPLILGAVSVLICGLYVFSQNTINGSQEVATALFTALTQGVLIAAASVYANQIIKQETKDE